MGYGYHAKCTRMGRVHGRLYGCVQGRYTAARTAPVHKYTARECVRQILHLELETPVLSRFAYLSNCKIYFDQSIGVLHFHRGVCFCCGIIWRRGF